MRSSFRCSDLRSSALSLTAASFEVGPHQGDTRMRIALALLPLVFPAHPAHCTREGDPFIPWCAWVCTATYTNVPGHHLNSSDFQLTQQKFLKMYDTWGKLFPNFESWGRFSSFLVGLVLAFILRCRGSWNISISLSLMGLSWSHS